MSKIIPGQINVSTGTANNDTLTTKGYVDDAVASGGVFTKAGTIISPTTIGDSLNIKTGCFSNTDYVSGYNARFSKFGAEGVAINADYEDNYFLTSGDCYQSFTAVNNDYFTTLYIVPDAPLPITNYTISIYAGVGTGGTLLYTFQSTIYGFFITLPVPLKLTSSNQYTIRFQGGPFGIWLDSGQYTGGSFNGTSQSMAFLLYTAALVDYLTVDASSGSVSFPYIGLTNGIVFVNDVGSLGSSTNLPSTTTTTTQAYGTNNTTLSTTQFVQSALAGLPAELWLASAGVLHPNDAYNINIGSSGLGNVNALSDYNFKYVSSAEALSVSVTDTPSASDYGSGDDYFSFTALDNNYLTKFQIQIITFPTLNETVTIIKGEGIGGTVLWTSALLGLVNGWNTIIVTTPVPLAAGQKYTIRFQGNNISWIGQYPKRYTGGITNLVYVFPFFNIFTTATSANFIAKRSTGYFGFGGTSDPTEMVDITGNAKVSGTVKTDLITEKTSTNGIGFSVNSHTGKIKDNTNKWFYLTATGTNDDGMGVAIPYALTDGWFFGKGMGASNTFGFGTAGTETTLTGDGQFKTNKLTLGSTQQVDSIITNTTLTGSANTNLASTAALKAYIDNKSWGASNLFIAVKNSDQNAVTGDGTYVLVTYGDEKKDVGNNFDGTYYVAPAACTMSFKVGCVFDIAAGTNTWFAVNLIRLNSSDVTQETVTLAYGLVADNLDATGNVDILGRSADMVMAAGDKVAVRVAVAGNGTKNVSITSYNYQRFSGFLTYAG